MPSELSRFLRLSNVLKEIIVLVFLVLLVGLSFLSLVTVLAAPSSANLIGHWQLDEGAGTVTANAASSTYKGTFTSTPTWTGGISGKALSFNGTDYVDMGNVALVNGVNKITLTAWIKRSASGAVVVLGKSASNSQNFSIEAQTNGTLRLNISNGTAAYGSFTVNDTNWHHVALVFDGTQTGNSNRLKGYLDGVPQTLTFSGTIPATATTNTTPFRLGRTASTYSNGLIDDVWLFTRVLTPAEVLDLTIIPPDIQVPTVPVNLIASRVATSSLNLAWASSTDNVDVTGYKIFRDGSQIAATTTVSFNDTGLTASTTYSYAVSAYDAAGNVSATSSTLLVTTSAIIPIITIGETTITPVADNGNGNLLLAQNATLPQTATIQSLSFYVTTTGGNIRLGIYDAKGPGGGPGTKKAETVSITPTVGWNTAPVITQVSLPAGTYWLAYLPSSNTLAFRKNNTTGTRGVYYSFSYGTMPATFSTAPTNTTSHWSFYATLNTTPDTTPPAISGTTASTVGSNSATISWTTNEPATGQVEYGISTSYGSQSAGNLNLATSHSETLAGLSHETLYHYRVASRDSSNNLATSSDFTFTTSFIDVTPPSTPVSLSATAVSSVQVNLSWATSTDDVVVAGYKVFRDGNQIATTTAISFNNVGLMASTTYSYTVSAFDVAGNVSVQSEPAVAMTPGPSSGLGLLQALPGNPHYFTDGSGKAVLLTGSHTWNDFQDWGTGGIVQPFDFTAYVQMLATHGQNFTLLWNTELPHFCGLPTDATGNSDYDVTPQPWLRTGPGLASDGKPKFDLTQFNPVFFDRMRARVAELNASGVYAGVYLYSGEWLNILRCANDGYPFTGSNNINGINDGYTGGINGIGSIAMTSPNAITVIQDAYVQKMIDTLNDLPNALWIISEESPVSSTWWNDHQIAQIRSYESTKLYRHPIGYAEVLGLGDSTVYNSDADWVAPGARISPTASCGSGTPACKVNVNDSDHSYFGIWNDSPQANRNYFWENFTNGNQVIFMDPFEVYYPRENRNLCLLPVHGICSGPDTRWENVRNTMGYARAYASRMNLAAMTSQGNLTSTANALANTSPVAPEFLVYSPSGGTFTVNLSSIVPQQTLNVEWLNPSTGAVSIGASVVSGANRSLTAPFSGDAVVYIYNASLDTQAPTVPTNLVTPNVAMTSLDLAWTSSADNVSVTGYKVFRNNVQIATTTVTSFSDSGLAPNTLYTYAVSAFDAARNVSAKSTSIPVTTLDIPLPPDAPAYPLKLSSNSRYLVDQNNAPVPIEGRTAWFVISLPVADYQTFLNDTAARGYNAIEMMGITHYPNGNNPPFNGNGNLPFLKRLNGTAWNGALTYTNISSEAPDFSTPNEAYWSYMDAFLAYAESKGIMVMFFPSYSGAGGGTDGWMQEKLANGPTKMNVYGTFLSQRYKNQKNLVWMLGGDYQGNATTAELDAENALITGLKSSTPQQSTFFSAEWGSGMIGTDQSTFGPTVINLNSIYDAYGHVAGLGRRAYIYTHTEPAFLLEEPYDEEGPDGNTVIGNPSATQPVRRFQWWGWLSTVGGYVSGNGYVWPFNSGWQTHLNTQNTQDMARLNTFIKSIPWYQLVPSGLTGMKTLITAGNGSTPDATNYVTAAATPDGTLLVAYIPPAHTGSITVDMTAMSGPVTARWFDPTTAVYTTIAGGPFANTGTRQFTPPAINSSGYTDQVLVLTTISDTEAPTIPTGVTSSSPSPSQASLSWSPSTDNFGVAGYNIFRDGLQIAISLIANFLDNGLTASAMYGYAVAAYDMSGNTSAQSPVTNVTTLAVPEIDTQAPTVPTDLAASGVTTTSINLAWTSSTDNVGVAGYNIFRNVTQIATATLPSFSDTGLVPNTLYSYVVSAYDATGNTSAQSAPLSVTTVSSSTTITMGETTVFTSDDSGNANLLLAQDATLAQTATIKSLSFNVRTASGNLRLGVYDASGPGGGPGVLEAQTNSFVAVKGWNTANVITPVLLPAGDYWLAYLPSSSSLHFSTNFSIGTVKYVPFVFGPMPATFPTVAGQNVTHWSLYSTLTTP